MRLARTGLQVALIVGALTLSAPLAVAAEGDAAAAGEAAANVRITPWKVSPGTTVTVSTTACGKETYGKGESEVAGPFHLFEGDRKGVLVGEFKVPAEAASGTDTVTLKCPPRIKLTSTYQIAGRPNGPVDAGFGGSADSDTSLGLGWLLVGGAVAGGVIRMRRRATARGTAA
ncbi:sortase [Streptomyces sp. Je 1-79]|uniref:sortase n=1 Tax=Streptomyces sp. Je 1-79 TaxID=2943847 RepID=UPI0021A34FF1|nr:sortase [Streptomyces sp. Je 1-79]MCT4351718.1 sortase [Streptomyces sp. Je 1-79]